MINYLKKIYNYLDRGLNYFRSQEDLINIIIALLFAIYGVWNVIIGYYTKNSSSLYFSIFCFSYFIFLLLPYLLEFNKTSKIIQFMFGFVKFNEEKESFNSIEVVYALFKVMAFFFIFVLLVPKGFLNITFYLTPEKILIPSISLVLAGAALSSLSFNHANSLNDKNGKVIISAARRFYISTHYSIITISLAVLILCLNSWLFHFSPTTLDEAANIGSNTLIIIYFQLFLISYIIMVYLMFFLTTICFFIDGLRLSFKGTIK